MKAAWRTVVVACVLSSLAGCGPSAEEKFAESLKKIAERIRVRESFGEDNPPVASLVFDPYGKTLASGHSDGKIRLWDVATGKAINTLEGHTDVVTSIVFLPDGKTLGSGSLDRTIKLWEVASGKTITSLEGHNDAVSSIALNPQGDTLASGSLDRTIKLWSVADKKVINTLEGHSNGITSVAFRPDGKTLASGSLDRTIKLWDVASGKANATLGWDEKHSYQPSFDGVACLAFSPDGNTLAAGSQHSWIFHWDVDSGKIIGWTPAQYEKVSSVSFGSSGKTLASCCMDDVTSIKLWDMVNAGDPHNQAGGIPLLPCLWQDSIIGHTYAAAVTFSPDGKTLASGQGKGPGKIKFWDVSP